MVRQLVILFHKEEVDNIIEEEKEKRTIYKNIGECI